MCATGSKLTGLRCNTNMRVAMLTGLICIEEVKQQRSSGPWKRSHSSTLSALTAKKWTYGVLQHGTLKCFRKRTDIKHNRPPIRIIHVDLHAALITQRQSLVVRCRKSSKALRIRIHPCSSSSYLQWVTAIYIARLEHCAGAAAVEKREKETADHTEEKQKAKRVTFHDEVCSTDDDKPRCSPVSSSSCSSSSTEEEEEEEELVDPRELYYSRQDYARFREIYRTSDSQTGRSSARTMVRSLIERIRRKEPQSMP